MRVLLCNPNGITGPGKFSKISRIQQKALTYQLDVLCMVEQSQNLKRIPTQWQLRNLTQGWWQHRRVAQAYNRQFDSGKESQVGGVSLTINDSLAHRSTTINNDPTGLGRWTSILVKGTQGFSTRIICAYRPCKSSGPDTAYIQHAIYFNQINRKGDPRKMFMEDLADAIVKWRSRGEQIILTGDFNTGDKTSSSRQQSFWDPWLRTTGLVDVHKQVIKNKDIPSTHERGTVRIDYMFVSPSLRVKRAGFLPFSKFPGDHRAIWMDVDLKDVIGHKPPALSMAQARRLRVQDPRIVQRYLSSLTQSAENNNLFLRLDTLHSLSPNQWTQQHTQEYEEISHLFRTSMLQAESTCRKLHTGKHPWSPLFETARRRKFYWELTVKKLYGLKVPMRRICKLHKRLKMTDITRSLSEALINQKLARSEYRRLKRQTQRLRVSFREDLAAAISSHKNISRSSALRDLINREESRDMHRRIKWMRKKYRSQSTSGVLLPNHRGEKILVTDKDTLETAIIKENEMKFHQTEGWCPLTRGRLLQDIGLCGTGCHAQDILAGSYTPPSGTSKYTKSFLSACKKPSTFSPSPFDHLSKEQYIRAWASAKEDTGSGQVHFGHWKAGIQDSRIAQAEWLLTTLPAQHGFSPSLWQKATDVMILKKSGTLDIDKLRTIVLYEADFNFLNKCIGRQAMDNAMQNGGMAKEQYAKPQSSAQEQCLTRRLIFDIVRHTRQSLAMASSDLKSCYDRIVHSAASLALQRNGISPQAVTTMFETIQNCRHVIRTAYGDSTRSYGGQSSYDLPPMGVGQGNGAGPQMWAVLSSTLFLAMHMEGLSTTFCQKVTKQLLSLVGFMYVDDMDLIRIRDDTDPDLISEDLQLALKYWNKLVQVTGGALEPKKSGWYAFGQIWDSALGKYIYKDLGSTGDITAKDKDGKCVPLPFISCNSSQEMIGVKMTPTGDHKDQISSMLEKSKEESGYLRKGNLSSVDTMQALKTSIIPRVSWPLVCMSITKEEGKRLLRPVLKSSLPKLGVVSTLGYDFIHGSSSFQGLGIPDLFHLTYARQIEMLIDHVWKSSQTGYFMMMAIQEFMLEAGTSHQPFAAPRNSRLSCRINTRNTWVESLHNYTTLHDIQVTLPLPSIPKQRINDCPLMDILASFSTISTQDLKDINVCRLYKRIYFLSDIMTCDGTRLSAFTWDREKHCKISTIPFNPQAQPIQRQWRAWMNAMHTLQQSITSHQTKCLGNWIMTTPDYFAHWNYFFHTQTKQLFRRLSQTEWCTFSPKSSVRNTRQMTFHPTTIPSEPPLFSEYLCRCTVVTSSFNLTIESYSPHHPVIDNTITQLDTSSSCTSTDIKTICSSFSDSKWAMKFFESSQNIDKLIQDFIMGSALFVGDGSYDDVQGWGAGACIAASSDGSEYIIIGGPTPGPTNTQSAYRSEVGTCVGMAILARSLSIATNSNPVVTVACDNDKALERPFLPRSRISPNQKSADLVSVAHDLWSTSKLTPKPVRVKGHADTQDRDMTILETLNCIVDQKAKEYLSMRSKSPNLRPINTNFGFASISIQGEEITGTIASSIQTTQALERSKLAGIRHDRFTRTTWHQIDHRALARSSSIISTSRKIFITKWISKQLPVGTVLLQRKHRIHDMCPMCKNTKEDIPHLLTCPSSKAQQAYLAGLEKLSTWMQKSSTDPNIQNYIISILSLRRSQPSATTLPYPCKSSTPQYHDAFKAQESIGWDQFSEGLISLKWATLQHQYYKKVGSRRNGKTWAAQLISQLWDLNFHIWQARNDQLHTNQSFLNQLHGQDYLDTAIEQEFCHGKGNLPPTFFPFFSKYTLPQLKSLPIDSKLKWFKTIRTAREDNGWDGQDIFATNPALRKWVGLRPR